jgi:hypothetical protein
LYPKQASNHTGFSSVSLSPQASCASGSGWKHAYFRSVYEILRLKRPCDERIFAHSSQIWFSEIDRGWMVVKQIWLLLAYCRGKVKKLTEFQLTRAVLDPQAPLHHVEQAEGASPPETRCAVVS